MLVSDPAFAAQRHSDDAEVFHYDDPGCLLIALDALEREGHSSDDSLYFHHHEEDRWLRGEETAFAKTASSPMGYGLGAIAVGDEPGELSMTEARASVVEQARARRKP